MVKFHWSHIIMLVVILPVYDIDLMSDGTYKDVRHLNV